jgi:hypothetical protein
MTVTDVADELERRATGCLAGAKLQAHADAVAKLRQLPGRSGL